MPAAKKAIKIKVKKKPLHPALAANAEKLKNGEALSPGTKGARKPTKDKTPAKTAPSKKAPVRKPRPTGTKRKG